jgi:hypothetical protein
MSGLPNQLRTLKTLTMKRYKTTILLFLSILLLLCVNTSIHAQTANSLYFLERTAVQSQWNPSMTPDRTVVGVGASNIGLSVYSDLAYSDLFIPTADGKSLQWFLNSNVDPDKWLEGIDDLSNFGMEANVDLLNLGLKIGKNYLTINAGIHADCGMGLPKDFLKFFVLGMDESASSTTFDMSQMNISALMYSKMGIGLSRKIGKIKVGATINYLQGLASMQMGFDELTLESSSDKFNVTSNGYVKLTTPDMLSLQYDEDGYLSGIESNDGISAMDVISPSKKCGSGVSFDIGASTTLCDFITVAAAVTDLGSIKWKKESISQAKSNSTYEWEAQELQDDSNSGTIADDFADMIHFTKDDNTKDYVTKLTTKINVSAEASFLNNHVSLGVLSQSGIAENGNYQDFMFAANFKPAKFLQAALTYSTLHGERSAFGAALNTKLLFLNFFIAADYIPTKLTPQLLPVDNSYINVQTGFNLMF